MKAPELRKLDSDELAGRIEALRNECFNLRIKYATGQLESAASLRNARRSLARALTVNREGRSQ